MAHDITLKNPGSAFNINFITTYTKTFTVDGVVLAQTTATFTADGVVQNKNAVSLNGSSQYLKVDNFSALNALTDFTIETWVRNTATSVAYAPLLRLDNGTTNYARITTENGTGNQGFNFSVAYSGDDADGYEDATTITQATWKHVALVHRASEKKTYIYIDGAPHTGYNLQRTATGTITDTTGASLYLGFSAPDDPDKYFDGAFGGFLRMWTRALTDAEILYRYNKTINAADIDDPTLKVNVNFGEATGTVSDNDASAGEDLDFVGTPTWIEGPTLSSIRAEQHSYRWRNDDGDEDGATWLASLNTAITRAPSVNTRLRTLVNGYDDLPASTFRLEYKRTTDTSWTALPTTVGGITTHVNETLNNSNGTGSLHGNASNQVGYLQLTPATNNMNGSIYWSGTLPLDNLIIEFDLYAGGGNGADAVYAFIGTTSYDGNEETGDGGYRIAFTEYRDKIEVRYNASLLTDVAQTDLDNGTWRTARIEINGTNIKVYLDDVEKINYTDSSRTFSGSYYGIGARTGGLNNEHRIRNLTIQSGSASTTPFALSPSTNITASGENTTAQLTAPSGKTTSDFVAGRIMDDENPADSVNITANDYTELEWCLVATSYAVSGATYEFRVSMSGVALDYYTQYPQWIIPVSTQTFTADGIVFAQNTKTFTVDAIIGGRSADLIDNFNDNTTDTELWSVLGTPSETGGQLEAVSGLTSLYSGYYSNQLYDLTSSYIQARLINAGNQALTTFQAIPARFRLDVNNSASFIVSNGVLVAQTQVANSYTDQRNNVSYDATVHKYFRLREASGTLYWEYATDGVTWTEYWSMTNPFAVTDVEVQIIAGNYGVEASTTTAIFDDLNVVVTRYTETFTVDGIVLATTTSTFTADAKLATRINLIRNPSFENNITDWWDAFTSSGSPIRSRDTTVSYFGTASFKIDANGVNADAGLNHNLTLPPGTYTLSGYIKTAGITGDAKLVMRNTTNYASDINLTVSTATTDWVRVSGSFTVETTTNFDVLFGIGPYGAPSQGVAWFDGIMLERVGSALPYFDGSRTNAEWQGDAHASRSNLYADITTATFTVDGVIEEGLDTFTATFTVDGIVLAQTTNTFTVDGVVLATQTSTFTVDGIVKTLNNPATFTVDGIVLATQTVTFTVDAIVKQIATQTFTADGIVRDTFTETFTVDGVIQIQNVATFTVDGIVQTQGNTSTFTVDGVVLALTQKTFTVDAIVLATQTSTFTVDGVVRETQTEKFTTDGIVFAVNTQTFTVDAIVFATNTQAFTVDGLINGAGEFTIGIDGIVLVQNTNTFTVDGIVVERTSKTYTVDGVIKQVAQTTFTVDGIVRETFTKTFTVDGIILVVSSAVFTVDGIIRATQSTTITTDAIVRSSAIQSFTVDGIIRETNSHTITVDAIVLATQQTTVTADGIVRATQQSTFTVDAIVLVGNTALFTVDGVIAQRNTQTFTVEAVVQAVTTTAFTVDAEIIQRVGLLKTITVDGYIRETPFGGQGQQYKHGLHDQYDMPKLRPEPHRGIFDPEEVPNKLVRSELEDALDIYNH